MLNLRDEVLVPIAMQGYQEVPNKISGVMEKMPNKDFSINLLANRLEQGKIILPWAEDYMGSDEDWGVVTQMRRYMIEGYSVSGKPMYSKTADHTMTALYLAVLGFQMKMSDLGRVSYDTNVGVRGKFDYGQKPVIDAVGDVKKIEEQERRRKARVGGKNYDDPQGSIQNRDVAFSSPNKYNSLVNVHETLRGAMSAQINRNGIHRRATF